MGEALALEAPVEADLVMPVPDSGTPAAIGFARASGIPFAEGLIKNRYVGRTFIQPDQGLREQGVKLKYHPLAEVTGKRVVVVDDSIVRGTTMRQLTAMLQEAGATEVYACATHGLFPGNSFEKIQASELREVTVTNTVPIDPLKQPDKVKVVPVSRLLAETIQNVFSDESVSAIFAGENQLF